MCDSYQVHTSYSGDLGKILYNARLLLDLESISLPFLTPKTPSKIQVPVRILPNEIMVNTDQKSRRQNRDLVILVIPYVERSADMT